MVNGVSIVESVWSMVFQWWRLYGEWCFNGGICMVNGVANGRVCMVIKMVFQW